MNQNEILESLAINDSEGEITKEVKMNIKDITLSSVSTWQHHHAERKIEVKKRQLPQGSLFFKPWGEYVSQYDTYRGYYDSHIVVHTFNNVITIPLSLLSIPVGRKTNVSEIPSLFEIIKKVEGNEEIYSYNQMQDFQMGKTVRV